MMRPICFSCREELHYISNRRMMCYNKTCEKIYGMDYECAPCSAKKGLKVLMEVAAPGEVRCPLCGDKGEALELNLETMMRSGTIARLGSQARTSTGNGSVSRIGNLRTTRRTDSTQDSSFFSTKSRPAGKEKSVFSHHTLSTFPERAELYIDETDTSLTIIIEFPRHTLEQIQWHKEGTNLIIESAIITCPYRDEITLPNWAIEPSEAKFLNRFLTIRFTK